MKRFLTVMAVVITMMTLLCVATFAAPEIAYEGKSGDCNITILKDGTMYITGSGKTADIAKGSFEGWQKVAGDIAIKKVVIGKDVTKIGAGLLANDSNFNKSGMSVNTVVFETGRTAALTIGQQAFANLDGLSSISLPETTTTIAAEAFLDCDGLSTVVLPKSLTSIGQKAFQSCGNLSNINLHKDIKNYGARAFDGTAISSVTIYAGATYAYDKTNKVGTFAGCGNLSTVYIEEGVTEIAGGLFKNCGNIRGDIYIPSTVTSIGDYAFWAGRITSITVAQANHAFWSDGKVLYALDNEAMTAEVIFAAVRNEGAITIPASIHTYHNLDFKVTAISPIAFNWGNANLAQMYIKAAITEINPGQFRDASVTYVELPDSVTKIGYNAFRGSKITTIDIPAAVESIGYKAFQYCLNLKSVFIPEGSKLTSLGMECFDESPIDVLGVIPTGVTTQIGAFARTSLDLVVYAGNTTEWYDYLFELYTIDASKGKLGDGSYAKLLAATVSGGTKTGSYIVSGYDWEDTGAICLGDIDAALLYDSACDDCAANGKCKVCDGKGDCLTCKGSGKCTTCAGSGNCTTCGGDMLVNCATCAGSKKVTCTTCSGAGLVDCATPDTCADCIAAGATLKHQCGACKATGKVDCTACVVAIDCTACEAGLVTVDCATCEAGLVACTDTACTICAGLGKHVCATCEGVGTVSADCEACEDGTVPSVSGTAACTACQDGKCTSCAGSGLCTGECLGSGDCYYCDGDGKCPVCLATKVVKVICNHHRAANNCTNCNVPGMDVKIGSVNCAVCGGASKTAYKLLSTTAASCESYGYAIYGCEVCDMTIKVPAVTKVGDKEYGIGSKPAHTIENTAEGTVAWILKHPSSGACAWYYICTTCGQDSMQNGTNCYWWMMDEEQNRSYEYWNTERASNHAYAYTPNFDGGCAAGSGTMSGACIHCGLTSTVKDPTTTVHTGAWTVLQAPTCTTEGYQSRVCSGCGAFDSAVIPALGHEMSDYVADGNAICVAGYGTMTSSCANCDLEITVTDNATTADNHVYMNGACYFCGAKQPANAPATNAPAVDSDVVAGDDTTAAAGNEDDAVNTGDSLVVAVAAAIMAIGTAVIVKKVR